MTVPEGLDDPDESHGGGEDTALDPTLSVALQALPVLSADIYLQLQAFNLGVVDSLLSEWEHALLRQYEHEETTPVSTAVVVGALGQLWVFGLYELLRTWRQRSRSLLRFADELSALDEPSRLKRLDEKKAEVKGASADPTRPNAAHLKAYEQVATDPEFRNSLQNILDRSEWPFHKLEALRVHLAKHEIPKVKGSHAMAPGYTRIDPVTESICWHVSLGDMEIEIISRRRIAELCRRFGTDSSIVILPSTIQKAIEPLPLSSYGVKQVVLIFSDGSEREAFVAWNRQVLNISGLPPVAIDPAEVVGVRAV